MKSKIDRAVEIAFNYGQIDGSHHRLWVIDQMMRVLLEPKEYIKMVKDYEEDGEYEWDIGIPP